MKSQILPTKEARLKKTKRLMGSEANKYTDEQLLKIEDNMRTLARIIIDKYLEMTPEERKKWHEEHKDASVCSKKLVT